MFKAITTVTNAYVFYQPIPIMITNVAYAPHTIWLLILANTPLHHGTLSQ